MIFVVLEPLRGDRCLLMITVSNLEFQYRSGVFLLRIPELSIERSSTMAIIDPSGTNKISLESFPETRSMEITMGSPSLITANESQSDATR